jgi:formate transporter
MDQRTDPLAAPRSPQLVMFDPILPDAMAIRGEQLGVKKAATDPLILFVLAVLGGAFISFGAIFATTVSAGSISVTGADGLALSGQLPFGVTKLLTGLSFSLGLILVLVAGAELFTGNTMIVMAWASRRVSTVALLGNWVIAFCGNCLGAILTAGLMFYTTQYTFGDGAVGLAALYAANGKTSLGFVPAFALGIMCNALVCLAVWMCYGGRTALEKIFLIIPPVAAFVAAGFEHCIANAYYIPIGLFIKAGATDAFWTAIHKTAADFPSLTWQNFVFGNLLPVTLGNIVGGSVMVGVVYWFVYLRPRGRTAACQD